MKTNPFALTLGACPEHEFDLVELHDNSLEPGRAGAVRDHLQHCTRCQGYLSALGEFDAALNAALPHPTVSPGFDARLQDRIAELTQAPDRSAALAMAEREHARMLRNLGQGLSWLTVLNATALASVVGGVIVGLDAFAPGMLQSLGLVGSRMGATMTFSIALGAVFAAYGAIAARRPAIGGLNLLAG